MSNMHDLPYPQRLIVEMLHYSVWTCEKTKDKRLSETKAALEFFFEPKDIDLAVDILQGKAEPDEILGYYANGKPIIKPRRGAIITNACILCRTCDKVISTVGGPALESTCIECHKGK